jgi:hypothetical protein
VSPGSVEIISQTPPSAQTEVVVSHFEAQKSEPWKQTLLLHCSPLVHA